MSGNAHEAHDTRPQGACAADLNVRVGHPAATRLCKTLRVMDAAYTAAGVERAAR